MAALRAHVPGFRVTLVDHRLEVAALGAIWATPNRPAVRMRYFQQLTRRGWPSKSLVRNARESGNLNRAGMVDRQHSPEERQA